MLKHVLNITRYNPRWYSTQLCGAQTLTFTVLYWFFALRYSHSEKLTIAKLIPTQQPSSQGSYTQVKSGDIVTSMMAFHEFGDMWNLHLTPAIVDIQNYNSKIKEYYLEHSCQIRWISHRCQRRSNDDILADF